MCIPVGNICLDPRPHILWPTYSVVSVESIFESLESLGNHLQAAIHEEMVKSSNPHWEKNHYLFLGVGA